MTLSEFLDTVITASKDGYLNLLLRPVGGGRGSEYEQWFKWPDERTAAIEFITNFKGDCYFSPYLFQVPKSLKVNAIQGRTIAADLDEAKIDRLTITPTVIVKTSKARHQAYWVMETESKVHEQLSKNLTYSIPKCDPSGWCIGHRFRLPDTLNYKYDPPQATSIVFESGKAYKEDIFTLVPEVSKGDELDLDWLGKPFTAPDIGPLELLETVRSAIPLKVYLGYKSVAADRSEALWALMCALFRAGLTREQVYWLAYNSPNNKFSGQRYNGDRDLAKDVLRAEIAVTDKAATVRDQMEELRHMGGLASDRKQLMANLAISDMSTKGRFIHTREEELWYVVHSQGRPIVINRSSGYLDTLLTINYGLNASEMEHRYVVSALDAHARSITPDVERGVLSYYSSASNTLLLHCGGSNILRITQSTIERVPNGSIDVMFPWLTNADPFMPVEGLDRHWSDILFNGALDTIVDTEKRHAKALLTCWFLFMLMRHAVPTKPLVAFFGQPGAGKSTLFKRIYRLLYGTTKALGAVTTPDNFDHAVANDPFLVLDNVDTWEKWLPDRLALCAGNSEIVARKLYTDNDTITLKRQAVIGLTAHNPKFSREDIVDRLLIFTFERLSHFKPESEILDTITRNRAQLWGSIVSDLQLVLAQDWPHESDLPQFRIEDFSRLGFRIAKALHIEDDFVASLTKVRNDQRQFNLGEDDILVNAIVNMIANPRYTASYEPPAVLWNRLSSLSTDPRAFEHQYKNSNLLGKKLWAMQDTLQVAFTVDYEQDRNGVRRWRFLKHD